MHVLRRTMLLDAFETDRQRNQQNHRNDDDENRTPRQNTRHRATHGRTDRRSHSDDKRSDAHQSPDLRARRLFKDDVVHQWGGDARTDALNHTSHQNHRKCMPDDHDERAKHGE